MSAFHPTTIMLDPPPDLDPRSVALVTSLRRNVVLKMTWNMPLVLIVGMATLGLAPVIALLLRFRTHATAERFQLEHVREWLREREAVSAEAERLVPRATAWPTLVWLGLAGAVVALVVVLIARSPVGLLTLYAPQASPSAFAAYVLALGVAQLGHYDAIKSQRRSLGCFLLMFNRVANEYDIPAVAYRRPPARASADWTIVGVLLLIAGCAWGLPMMLAAGAHRRYINEVSRDVREQIADRIEQMRGRDSRATGS